MEKTISAGTAGAEMLWFRAAVIYLLIAVSLGVAMGARGDFMLRSVHSHLNLLGWVSLALVGLIYLHLPQLGRNRLARSQFWLHNLGLAAMTAGLIAQLHAYPHAGPLLGLGSLLLCLAVALFAINILYCAQSR